MQNGEVPCVDPFVIFMYSQFTSEEKFLICKKHADQKKQMTLRNIHASGLTFYGYKHQALPLNVENSPFKIRLGYVSFDFADHPLAHLLASIFRFHDRSKF